ELVGDFKNAGQEWQPQGEPERVKGHDFPDPELGKASPYGVYDQGANAGWVSVGTDHDTAEFAVESIRRWWNKMGRSRYPDATKLLITADCGGSNGYRVRLWKVALQRFSNETGLCISVCHFPPGTSKWNKIEHRMFSYISMNWRGRPLISHETIVNLIGCTTTRTGLTINAELDVNLYEKGIRVSDEELEMVNITKAKFHGEWNYSINVNCSG
ncbi:MAG: ISAzo13 family transposase, partial [Planctomycetota bacterium]